MSTTPPVVNAAARTCPQCGAQLAADAPQGLCPKCLMAQGLKGSGAPAAPETIIHFANMVSGAFPFLAGYQIQREISRGGQAVVYEAIQQSTTKRVAVKVMQGGAFIGPTERARFEREVQILAALNHPNIVQVTDRGTTADGSYFLVMPYLSGQPLDKWLLAYYQKHPDGPPPEDPSELLRLFLRICDAVNAAHLRGVVHRDLKPSNIRIDDNGEPHILDFGLARTAVPGMTDEETAQPVTITGQFLGSLPYASPEQAEGAISKIDTRTDVYALGVILYQMLTGKFPYEVVGNMADVLKNIQNAKPSPPSTMLTAGEAKHASRRMNFLRLRRRPLNPVIDGIILKALAKRREDRYQSAGDFARDLGNYLSGRPVNIDGEIASPWSSQKTVLAIGTAAVLGLILAVVWYATRNSDRKSSDQSVGSVDGSRQPGTKVAVPPSPDDSWQKWPTVWEDLLTGVDSPNRFWWSRGVSEVKSPHMMTGEGMRVQGFDSSTAAWIQQPVGDRYALSVDMRWGERCRPRLWLNGPGYGRSAATGHLLDFVDPSKLTVSREGREIVWFTMQAPMEKGRWYRLDVIRDGTHVLLLLDHQKLGQWEEKTLTTDPLHAFMALGGDGGQQDHATEYRNAVLRMPQSVADDLKTRNVGRILDPPATVKPSANGAVIFEEDLSQDWEKKWELFVDKDGIERTPEGLSIRTGNYCSRVWRSSPLSGDFAIEWTISYPDPRCENFHAFLACGPVTAANAKKDFFTGWGLLYPDKFGDSELLWYGCEPSNLDQILSAARSNENYGKNPERGMLFYPSPEQARIITQAGYFAPIESRPYVLRLEKRGRSLRVFSNGCLLLQGEAPANLTADQSWYPGFGQVVTPVVIHRISAWQLIPADATKTNVSGPLVTLRATLTGHGDGVIGLAFSPDGKKLASGSNGGVIKLWDWRHDQEFATWLAHPRTGEEHNEITALAFSPDGTLLASASSDRTIKLWDPTTQKERAKLSGQGAAIRSVVFSPDGKTLYSGCDTNTVAVWDVATGRLQKTLTGASVDRNPLALSPDGRILVSGGAGGFISIWDAQTGQQDSLLRARDQGRICSMAFSADGKTFACGIWAKLVTLWDTRTGKELCELAGHTEGLNCVAFSPDGNLLASAGWDNLIKLWNVRTRSEIATLKGHSHVVLTVAFSPDGQILASASGDSTVKLWDIAGGASQLTRTNP